MAESSDDAAATFSVDFTEERVLVCEGIDDKRFFEALIRTWKLPSFQVFAANTLNPDRTGGLNGFERSVSSIKPLTSLSKVKLLVLAADNDAHEDALGTLKAALRNNGFSCPDSVGVVARSSEQGMPSTGIVLVPGERNGALEALCLDVLFEKWPSAQKCIETFLSCTGASSATPPWTESNLDKSRLHAAIAGYNRTDPEKGLRDCFQGGVIDVGHAVFRSVFEALENLAKE